MPETFPSTLPGPNQNYGFELAFLSYRGQGNRVKNESGTKPGKLVYLISVEWLFTDSEFAAFETFYNTTLVNGVLPFTIDLALGDGLQNEVVRFYEATRQATTDQVLNQKVTAKLICQNPGLMTEATFDDILAGIDDELLSFRDVIEELFPSFM